MKKVLLITTGGTIACTQTDEGLSPSLSGSELIKASKHSNISYIDLYKIDSSVMTNDDRILLAQTIWNNKDNYDGFVITHGTDTLAYTASFIACAIENFDKPIIFTGSQKPLVFEESDALKNLNDSLSLAFEDYRGVFVYSYDRLINAETASKISTESYAAFESVTGKYAKKGVLCDQKPRFNKVFLNKIALLTINPSLTEEIVYFYKNFNAVLILCYGAGGMSRQQKKAFEKLSEGGCRLFVKSQCLFGNISEDYAAHKKSAKFIAINEYSTEFALVKLMFDINFFQNLE